VDQSDLEFLLPADDTFIDLNIKKFTRAKLTNEDEAGLDNKYFTPITHNFIQFLFNQCSVTLNGVTINAGR
jgi:hypothetical protein